MMIVAACAASAAPANANANAKHFRRILFPFESQELGRTVERQMNTLVL
jgi:hypothetical protein